MNRRRREILNLLFNMDGYITGANLAEKCNVSLSTIRFDVKEINKELSQYDVAINSALKKGYYLTRQNKDIIRQNNIIRAVIDQEYISEMPSSPLERQLYILLKLTTVERLDIENLANILFISVSTLNNDVANARKWLKDRLNLSLRYSLKNGIRLSCSEYDKRNIIIWLMSKNTNESSTMKICNYLFGSKELTETNTILFEIINETTKKHGYFLSGHSLVLVSNLISVALARYRRGYHLLDQRFVNSGKLPVIAEIKERFEKATGELMPENEWDLIASYFLSCQFVKGTDHDKIKGQLTSVIIDDFYSQVELKHGYVLSGSKKLTGNLLIYIEPMLLRLKYNYPISNMIDENIVELYPLEFLLASEMAPVVQKQAQVDLKKSELAYLTLHLVATRSTWGEKIKTAIVCDFDESIKSFIETRIVEKYREQIEVVGWYTYQEFINGMVDDIDNVGLILTTATLADKTFIPLVMVSPFMAQRDINKIQEYLHQLRIAAKSNI